VAPDAGIADVPAVSFSYSSLQQQPAAEAEASKHASAAADDAAAAGKVSQQPDNPAATIAVLPPLEHCTVSAGAEHADITSMEAALEAQEVGGAAAWCSRGLALGMMVMPVLSHHVRTS
jgi:hypothetical protein